MAYKEDKQIQKDRNAMTSLRSERPFYNDSSSNEMQRIYNKIKTENKKYNPENDEAFKQYSAAAQALSGLGIASNQANIESINGNYGASYAPYVSGQAQNIAKENADNYKIAYYQLGQDIVNSENARNLDKYSVAANKRDSELSEYQNKVNAFDTVYDETVQRYENDRNDDYQKYADERDYQQDEYWKRMKQANADKEYSSLEDYYLKKSVGDYSTSPSGGYGTEEIYGDMPGYSEFSAFSENKQKGILMQINMNREDTGRLNTIKRMTENGTISEDVAYYLIEKLGLN